METPPATVLPHSPQPKAHRSRKVLVIIGTLKLIHAALMIVLAASAFWLTKSSVIERIRDWSQELNVGPKRRIIGEFLEDKLLHIPNRTLWTVVIGAAFYAILFATEGVGLLLDKLWAEWLAVIATASLIPLEIHETLRRSRWAMAIGIGTVLVNTLIVIYLAIRVRQRIRDSRHAG